MKFGKMIIKYLTTGNISDKSYEIAENDMYTDNLMMLRILSSISSSIFLICTILGLFVHNMNLKMTEYVAGLVISVAILLASFFSHTKKLHTLCMYMFDIMLLSISLMLSLVSAPEQLTITLIPVALLVPLFFDTKPYKFLVIVLSADLVYLICAPIVKPTEILMIDMVDVLTFSVAGIIIGITLTKVKVERYVYAHDISKIALRDELTDLYNRRAYEKDLTELSRVPLASDLVYISMDVNGLKVVNDMIGHIAGDEMILGSSKCMKNVFKPYGNVYRIGGDEFVSIINVSNEQLWEVLSEFDNAINGWTGELIDKLSISYGVASTYEFPKDSIRVLSSIAEKRMYETKAEHYKKQGVDRRGQHDAHKALCELYTKILRINLSDDSYQIVNMDIGEQTKEKGFSDKISNWLSSFGKSGQVHPDDVENYLKMTDTNYLRKYFMGHKETSLQIFYRRKIEDGYKKVMMEIIPTDNYSDANQSFFLYVKNIDI